MNKPTVSFETEKGFHTVTLESGMTLEVQVGCDFSADLVIRTKVRETDAGETRIPVDLPFKLIVD